MSTSTEEKHADRKMATWKHLYKHVYSERRWGFWGLIDFENLILDPHGYKAGFKESVAWNPLNEPFKPFYNEFHELFLISGDADFDLNASSVSNLFEDPEAEMHKFKNFSLMPCTGGMNNAKGKRWFPRYLVELERFYENPETGINPLFRAMGPKKKDPMAEEQRKRILKKALREYLMLFGSIYGYCDKVYLIDKTLTDELLEAGHRFEVRSDATHYKELALKYWRAREKQMKEIIPNNELHWMNVNIEEVGWNCC